MEYFSLEFYEQKKKLNILACLFYLLTNLKIFLLPTSSLIEMYNFFLFRLHLICLYVDFLCSPTQVFMNFIIIIFFFLVILFILYFSILFSTFPFILTTVYQINIIHP